MLVTVGGDRGGGQFLLAGGEAEVATLGPKSVYIYVAPDIIHSA